MKEGGISIQKLFKREVILVWGEKLIVRCCGKGRKDRGRGIWEREV